MKTLLLLSLVTLFVTLPFYYAHTEIPRTINYQARLFDEDGNPLGDGIFLVIFSIFEQEQGGTAIWTENRDVEVKDGFINVYLGKDNPLNIKFDKQLWLEVTITGNSPFPRTPLASTPTTFNAMESEQADLAVTVVDGSITRQKLADDAVTSDKISDSTIINADISNNANISVSKLAPGNNGEVLTTSGGTVLWQNFTLNGYWSTSGNTGTVEGNNFLGTTDNKTLELRVADRDTIHNILKLNNNGSLERDNPSVIGALFPGDARGLNAVDLQSYRLLAKEVASGDYSFIGSGSRNTVESNYSNIVGGYGNTIISNYSTIGGGKSNCTESDYTFIGGGLLNRVRNNYTTVGGGKQNLAYGEYSTIAGGERNRAKESHAAVGGGMSNFADTAYAFIGGGGNNFVKGINGVIGGGYMNIVTGNLSFVGGGVRNHALGLYSTIVAGDRNFSNGEGSFIGGGGVDSATGSYSTISGGRFNKSSDFGTTVGGGINNTAGAEFSTVTGGYRAVADKYGQNAYASGSFNTNPPYGDAQTSVFVVRNKTTKTVSSVNLYLDGARETMRLNEGDAWTFRALVVGKDNSNLRRAAYIITGLIIKNGTSTSIYAPVTTVIYESRSTYDATAVASNGSLVIHVTGDVKSEMRWVARVEMAQLNY